MRAIKPLIDAARKRVPNTLAAAEREAFVELFEADDTLEGVNAFLEERDPRWRNR